MAGTRLEGKQATRKQREGITSKTWSGLEYRQTLDYSMMWLEYWHARSTHL